MAITLTAANAHRLDPVASVAVFESIEQSGHDSGAGHAEWVTKRDRPAVHVQFLFWYPELVCRTENLNGECFVDLEQVDVVDAELGTFERFADGFDRAESHDLGVEARNRTRNDTCEWLDPEFGSSRVGHDHDCRSSVVQRAGVAGSDRAIGAKYWLELGDAFHRCAVSDAVVLSDNGPVLERVRGDLSLEEAPIASFLGTVLRSNTPLVLALAADPGELGDILSGLTHRDVDVWSFFGSPHLGAATGSFCSPGFSSSEGLVVWADVGCATRVPAHRLDPARYEDVPLRRP